MIRATTLLVLALALATTAQARSKPKAPPAEPSILEPADPAHHTASAPRQPAPAPTLRELNAASEAQVRSRLGAPDIARSEGTGAFWTYRLKTCALFVYFRSENGQPLAVSGAAAGPHRRGQTAPKLETCLAEFRERGDVSHTDDPIQAILDLPGADKQP